MIIYDFISAVLGNPEKIEAHNVYAYHKAPHLKLHHRQTEKGAAHKHHDDKRPLPGAAMQSGGCAGVYTVR